MGHTARMRAAVLYVGLSDLGRSAMPTSWTGVASTQAGCVRINPRRSPSSKDQFESIHLSLR